jgi:hypothetical protein
LIDLIGSYRVEGSPAKSVLNFLQEWTVALDRPGFLIGTLVIPE